MRRRPRPRNWLVCSCAGLGARSWWWAQRTELTDVRIRPAGDTIVVVDLATNSFIDEDYVQWRPSRIAAEQGVSCQAHLLGALASGVAGLSEEALAMRRDDLPRFLAGWSA